MPTIPVNYWAVLVCGIASMVLGMLYYGPIFGKMYSELMGFNTLDQTKRNEVMKGMTRGYIITFIGSLIMAWVLAHAIIFAQAYMNTSGLSAGLITGFMSWLGFVAPVTIGGVLWGTTSIRLWLLQNGHMLIQLLVFGAILGTWK